MDYIQGSTKSPSCAIYKDFQKTWPEIRERANNIDQLLFSIMTERSIWQVLIFIEGC